nr:immunoglobulin light chain junction region [Macaca mulatta]
DYYCHSTHNSGGQWVF